MATYQRMTVHSTDDIRAIADRAGSHFFDADTMRFFNSRLLSGVYPAQTNTGKWEAVTGNAFYFVTSERFEALYSDPEPRHYTVRKLTLTSVRDDRPAVDIETVGDYHATANAARNAAKAYAND